MIDISQYHSVLKISTSAIAASAFGIWSKYRIAASAIATVAFATLAYALSALRYVEPDNYNFGNYAPSAYGLSW